MTPQNDRPFAGETSLADLISEPDLAARWGVSLRTQQRRRKAGLAPPHLKIGRRVFHRIPDVLDHEEAATVRPEVGE